MNTIPSLRYVDAFPVDHEGETFVCVSDPTHYVEEQLVLSPPAFFLATCFDGNNDIAAVQQAFAHQFSGARVVEAQIQEIADYLDEHGFLLSPAFDVIKARVEATFAAASTRPAWLAGKAYPEDPNELRGLIDSFFTEQGGPGTLPESPDNGAPPLPCLIVPHIDFQRGGHAYAHGYASLHAHGKPDTVFVFGVAHAGAPVPFVLTQKHFDTPLGCIHTDEEVVARLEGVCSGDPYEWEIVHRTEHSIEFHAVMLAYLYGPEVKIVPILCASFSDDPGMSEPEAFPEVARFLDTCREIASEPGRRVAVIAAADLAHVGRRFGDPFDIDEAIIESVAERDREDLIHAMNCAPEAFYASVMKDRNERKVCGLGCIYAAMKTVEGTVSAGTLLDYSYAPDPAGGIVSFASVKFG